MPAWPGYAPWADTVDASREEFERVAKRFWLVPEVIPPVDRDDIGLLYCFCRRLDDAVDEAPSVAVARLALEQWRSELSGRAPARPLIAAFLAGAKQTGLSLESAGHLLDGMASDLEPVRVADDRALLRYAYQVSSSVGLMLAPLLGARGVEATWRVIDLGIGLQLSNVLLGVAEDARKGRVYLPATRLAEHGLGPDEVLRRPDDPRLRPVLRGVARLADRYYRSAEDGLATVPLRYRHGVMLLGRAYGALGWRVVEGLPSAVVPSGLPLRWKVQHLAGLVVSGARPHVLGLRTFPAHDAALHEPLAELPGVHT